MRSKLSAYIYHARCLLPGDLTSTRAVCVEKSRSQDPLAHHGTRTRDLWYEQSIVFMLLFPLCYDRVDISRMIDHHGLFSCVDVAKNSEFYLYSCSSFQNVMIKLLFYVWLIPIVYFHVSIMQWNVNCIYSKQPLTAESPVAQLVALRAVKLGFCEFEPKLGQLSFRRLA